MCLEIIDKTVATKRRTGYKVGWEDESHFQTGNQHTCIPYNEWVTDKKPSEIRGNGERYEAGYHVFLSKAKAIECNELFFQADVVKVEFKDVVASGEQCVGLCFTRVVVAKTIRIKKEQ